MSVKLVNGKNDISKRGKLYMDGDIRRWVICNF